jgi:hypothetical protein
MAALQGAKRIGADTRCTPNSSSSLFAYVKVSQPDDSFGSPSFVHSVRTKSGDEIEPIDSLQTLFDNGTDCTLSGTELIPQLPTFISINPNPSHGMVTVENKGKEFFSIDFISARGSILYHDNLIQTLTIDVTPFPAGPYFIRLTNGNQWYVKKMIKN